MSHEKGLPVVPQLHSTQVRRPRGVDRIRSGCWASLRRQPFRTSIPHSMHWKIPFAAVRYTPPEPSAIGAVAIISPSRKCESGARCFMTVVDASPRVCMCSPSTYYFTAPTPALLVSPPSRLLVPPLPHQLPLDVVFHILRRWPSPVVRT